MGQAVGTAREKCMVLQERYYDRRGWVHPYAVFRRTVTELLAQGQRVLEVGCGRTFALAEKLLGRTDQVFGVDPLVDLGAVPRGAAALRCRGEETPFEAESFDLVVSQSVLEHVDRVGPFFAEVSRVLRRGGRFVFLTPSKYDYVSLAAGIIPSRWHPWLVGKTEGRAESETFATFYRAKSRRQVRRLARASGLEVERLEYLHHCPSHLTFSPLLYRLGVFYDRVVSTPEALAFLRGWLFGVLVKS